MSAPFAEPLSPRETEVLKLIAAGRSSKEIAAELGVSVKTADTHRQHLMAKLNLHSVVSVVKYAIVNGLIDP